MPRNGIANTLLKVCFHLFLYDKYDFFKACCLCIVYRKIDYLMSPVIHGIHLLQTAVTTAHSGC